MKLNQLRTQFGLSSRHPVSWDRLLDQCVYLYWQNRPEPRRRRALVDSLPTPRYITELAGLAPCGTRSAAERHRKHGERPCALCRPAEQEYRQRYDAARAGRPRKGAAA